MITITVLIAAANRFSAGNKWIFLRATAESIKKEIYRYRAGQPNSPYSDFYDLDNNGAKYSAKEIFHMMYNRDGDVVFQT